MLYACKENTLNGEISTERVYTFVNNKNVKKVKSFYLHYMG